MYLTDTRVYYSRTGNQHAARAPFLILVQKRSADLGPDNFRAMVRQVALEQCGHWMMGYARAAGKTIAVSGAYGSNGFPVTVDDDVYEKGIDVPKELYDKWASGGGWNSCGSESEDMRTWAIENLLRRKP